MNFVALLGRIKGKKDEKTVLLEVNRPENSEDMDNLLIPCRYWTNSTSCLLTSLKEGTMLVIKGRLDQDKDIGTYVIVEEINIINNKWGNI